MLALIRKLFQRKLEFIEDYFWLTPEAKFKGIREQIGRCYDDQFDATLLVAHFDETFRALEPLTIVPELQGRIQLARANALTSELAMAAQFDEESTVAIIVAERHPLETNDCFPLEFARQLTCRSRIVHHISLDDPLFRYAAGTSFQEIITQLGMRQDEALQTALLSQRIRRAQRKVARLACDNLPANSAQEWVEKNCPRFGY